MTAAAKHKERLTRSQAQDRGLVPPNQVWDEELQEAVPRGMAMIAAQLDQPLDLERNLATFARNRETLLRFVSTYLVEAEYADGTGKEKKGALIPGRLHDFYRVPGSENKALTKLGAEKMCQLFRLGRASSRVVASTETKEYVSATVEVVLTDQYRRDVGSAVSSASTAEAGFRSVFAQKKYGATLTKENGELVVKTPPDYRAALNDVIARANKRAYVQAVLVASGADESFVVAEEAEHPQHPEERQQPAEPAAAPKTMGPVLPNSPALKQYAGKPVRELGSDALTRIHEALRKTKQAAKWQPVIDALADELDRRTQEILGAEQEDLGL